MKSEPAAPTQPLEPTFDRTPQPFGSGPPDPIVCDASARSLRQRTVNFAAKRMVDMLYVSAWIARPPTGIFAGGRPPRPATSPRAPRLTTRHR